MGGWVEIVSGVSGGGNRGRVVGCDEFGKEERGHGGGLNGEGVIVGYKVEEEIGGRGGKVRRGGI